MAERIALDLLNAASAEDFVAVLGGAFEHSPWVAAAAAARRPFASLQSLRDVMVDAVHAAEPDQRIALIRAHPDLANKTQRDAGMTDYSTSEQDGAGLDRLSEREFSLFQERNAAYKAKFGFPFILCVRRHTKESILDAFARRLGNDPREEESEALAEIARIASLRLAGLVDGDPPLPVFGRLSTHVLDTHCGLPAAGMAFALVELSRYGVDRVIAQGTTNPDGRTDTPLIGGRPIPIGRYELRFSAGDYFAGRGVALGDPPFLDVIPLRFGVSEPEQHLHVPLLVTPWSYTTYRGS
jgi:2-oxo-4-hydroxy-4-carboxy-5-ureidoimidazoline decarboxylase